MAGSLTSNERWNHLTTEEKLDELRNGIMTLETSLLITSQDLAGRIKTLSGEAHAEVVKLVRRLEALEGGSATKSS